MKEILKVLIVLLVVARTGYAAETRDSKPRPSAKPNESTKPLDLKPADIRKLFKPEQIAKSISGTIEKVEVTSSPELLPQTDSEMPQPWFGPAAPLWALSHPKSAWRILAPVSPDLLSGPPDLDAENLRSRSW